MAAGHEHGRPLLDPLGGERSSLEPDDERDGLKGHKARYQVTGLRWLIIFAFSFSSFIQDFSWFTFSAVPDETKQYYRHVSDGAIDWMINWGCIVYVPCSFFTAWLQAQENGLTKCYWLGAWLVLLGCLIRALPTWIGDELISSEGVVYVLHTAAIVNGAAGPIVVGLCSQVAAVWFADDERATATAIFATSNVLGTAGAFLIAPALVESYTTLPRLLYFEVAMACVPLVCGALYMKERPDHPPSAAAKLSRSAHVGKESHSGAEAWQCVQDVNFMFLALAGGAQTGVAQAWQGVLTQVLGQRAVGYSATKAGYIGTMNVLASVVGGLAAGPVVDRYFKRNLKTFIIIMLGGASVAFAWFTFSVPLPTAESHVSGSFAAFSAAMLLSGLLQGSTTPVFFELCAEVVFPVQEAISGTILTCMQALSSIAMLAVVAFVGPKWYNVICLASFVACFAIMLFVRSAYRRADAESAASNANDESAGDAQVNSLVASSTL